MAFRSPLLGLPGAVGYPDSGIAAHYGNPLLESRLLAEGASFVDVSDRGVVVVRGEDRLRWLNSMTSQKLDDLLPGSSVEAMILTPQGRIEFLMGVFDTGSETWLLTPPGQAEPLAEYLLKMRFMMRVEVEDRSEELAQIATFSDEIADLLRGVSETAYVWDDPWGSVLSGGHQYSKREPVPWGLKLVVMPRTDLGSLSGLLSAEVKVSGFDALQSLEIFSGRPGILDVDERSIPHELDWLSTAVHLSKGCYRGQETVAKVHNLGHPPRRLTLLYLDGADGETPSPGALIFESGSPDRPVGRITRAGLHHDWGVVALALLKRKVDEEAILEIPLPSGATATATQEIIVPTDAGATRDVPRLTRHR